MWRARRVRPGGLLGHAGLGSAGLLLFLAATSYPGSAQGPSAPDTAPAGHPPMAFGWTLLPGMWVEIDLRMVDGSEAVAEFLVTGGELRWDVHTHPPGAPPSALVILQQGTASAGRLRIVPDTPGRYSYRWENPNHDGLVRLRVTLALQGDARVDAVKP